ncbi:MAG: hypothetical protein Kow006_26950 [Gammaproteobacteria bacterium]
MFSIGYIKEIDSVLTQPDSTSQTHSRLWEATLATGNARRRIRRVRWRKTAMSGWIRAILRHPPVRTAKDQEGKKSMV